MFETYDLQKFGQYLKELRKSYSYTQDDVQRLSNVAVSTLKKIESGKVIPRFDTLVFLSQAYKKDLLEDFKHYQYSNTLFQYYRRLDIYILKSDTDKLHNLTNDFEAYSSNKKEDSLLDPTIIDQFKLLLEGASLHSRKEYTSSIAKLTEALKVSNPFFEVNQHKEYKYNNIENRILLILAVSCSNIKELKLGNELLKKCLESCNFDDEAHINDKLMVIKILFNLAYNAHLADQSENVLKYTNDALEYANKHHLSYAVAALLYRKGIAQYLLKEDGYLETLKLSLYQLKISGNHELISVYIDATKRLYDLDLEI